MQVRFVDEHKGKRGHRERQQRFFLCVQGLLLLQVRFLCLLQKFYQHPTSQGSEFWSWQKRNGDFKLVPIPSIHPLWSFGFFYSGTEEVSLNFFAFGLSCSLNQWEFSGGFLFVHWKQCGAAAAVTQVESRRNSCLLCTYFGKTESQEEEGGEIPKKLKWQPFWSNCRRFQWWVFWLDFGRLSSSSQVLHMHSMQKVKLFWSSKTTSQMQTSCSPIGMLLTQHLVIGLELLVHQTLSLHLTCGISTFLDLCLQAFLVRVDFSHWPCKLFIDGEENKNRKKKLLNHKTYVLGFQVFH